MEYVSILIHLPEGRAGEAREPCNKVMLSVLLPPHPIIKGSVATLLLCTFFSLYVSLSFMQQNLSWKAGKSVYQDLFPRYTQVRVWLPYHNSPSVGFLETHEFSAYPYRFRIRYKIIVPPTPTSPMWPLSSCTQNHPNTMSFAKSEDYVGFIVFRSCRCEWSSLYEFWTTVTQSVFFPGTIGSVE